MSDLINDISVQSPAQTQFITVLALWLFNTVFICPCPLTLYLVPLAIQDVLVCRITTYPESIAAIWESFQNVGWS